MSNSNYPVLPVTSRLSAAAPVIPVTYAQQGPSLTQVFTIIWAYWKQILIIGFVVMALTCLAIALWPRTYTATASLMVNYEVNDPLNGKELPTDLLGNYMATQIDLLQDAQLLLMVVDRLNLTAKKFYSAGYKGEGRTLHDWAANKLRKNLAITPGTDGSQMLYITYSTNDPDEAAAVANTLAEIYKEVTYRKSTTPSERVKRYEEQIDDLKNRVLAAQQKVTAFHQRHGLLDPDYKTNGDINILSTLELRLLEAQNARRVAEARASGNPSVGTEVLSSTLIQGLKTQLATQEARLAELSATLGARHPQIIELESQIDSTRRSLNTEQSRYSANAADGVATTRQLEQKLASAVAAQHDRVLALGKLREESAQYLLELESAEALYKKALEDYDKVVLAARSQFTNVSLVSRAKPPLKASKPRVLRSLFVGAVLAAVLGLGLPLGYELLRRRVRCRDDLERDHGLPVLIEFDALPLPRGSR